MRKDEDCPISIQTHPLIAIYIPAKSIKIPLFNFPCGATIKDDQLNTSTDSPNISGTLDSTDPSHHSNPVADVSLLLVALIWGINMAVMKLAITNIDPFVFNSVRLTLSAGVLGFCVWLENKKKAQPQLSDTAPSTLRKWVTIVAFAIFAGAVYQIIFIIGMHRTTAGNTALIMSSMPMWTAILAFIALREKIGVAWIGLTITFLGTLVVTLQNEAISLESNNLEGNLLILLSALAWAAGAVISRPMLNYVSPIRLAFYATAGTLPVHYLMPLLFGTQDFERVWEPEIMACILYSGIFSTGLAYAMWNYGVQQLGASHASVYQNLVPLVALASAWFFLRETITLVQLAGGFMIISGLFLTRRLRKRQIRQAGR